MVQELLQEEKQLSAEDIKAKLQKLEVFIKRAERRIDSHEKKLTALRAKQKEKVRLPKGGLTV